MAADYVIVGAGSAGCVLAARLTEDPDIRVVLLEAGGPDTAPEIHVPAMFPIMFKSSLDWDLLGEPEPGLDGRRLYLPRGRMIGGCSSINAMIYLRGNRLDYDDWAAEGSAGWSYDEVLTYFKRGEDNERGEDAFHGVGGPQTVSDSRSMHPLVDRMLEAAVQAGHAANPDLNGAVQDGVGRFQLTQRGGLRCSTADAYLHPAAERPNLEVQDCSFVERIVFEGDRAVGVDVVRNGVRETIRAEREVIVSAGAYQSPVLLMLSGIGLEEELAPFGIAVREQLPVGRNLQDHFMANLNYLSTEPALFGIFTPENFEQLRADGTRAADLKPSRGGRLLPHESGSACSECRAPLCRIPLLRRGADPAARPRLRFGPVLVKPVARVERSRCAPRWRTRSRASSATSSRLTRTVRASSPGRASHSTSLRSPRCRLSSGAVQRARLRLRRGHSRLGTPGRPAGLPPDLDVRDGGRGRLRATGLRRRRAPCRRRVGDAHDHPLQYARADDDDRREGCRPDPRSGAARGGYDLTASPPAHTVAARQPPGAYSFLTAST